MSILILNVYLCFYQSCSKGTRHAKESTSLYRNSSFFLVGLHEMNYSIYKEIRCPIFLRTKLANVVQVFPHYQTLGMYSVVYTQELHDVINKAAEYISIQRLY